MAVWGRWLTILENSSSDNLEVSFDTAGEFEEIPSRLPIPFGENFSKAILYNPNDEDAEIFLAWSEVELNVAQLFLDQGAAVRIDDETPVKMTVENVDPIIVEQFAPVEIKTPSAADQIVKTSRETDTSAATVLHTVTDGKVFQLTGATLTAKENDERELTIDVYNAVDVFQYTVLPLQLGGSVASIFASFPPLTIPAGYTVKFDKHGGPVDASTCSIYGYEVQGE